jgi:hypothetical protein
VATPSTPQANLTQQEVLSAELDGLDEDMSKLQVLYEKYFLGIDRKPPDQERTRLAKRMRELRTTVVRNTGVKFRINTLFAKLISFERLWDRTLREIEEGTYKRDVFKAKYRMNRRVEETPEQPRPPVPRAEISDDKLRRLFDTYVVARQRTGESTDGLTFEKVAQRIRAQVPQLMEKHGAKSVEFKVVIKGGRAVLKAIPHTE